MIPDPASHPLPLSSAWNWTIPGLALLAGLLVWWLHLEREIFFWLNGLGTGAVGTAFWANATLLGDTLIAVCLLALFAPRRPDIIQAVIIASLLATLWVHGLKPLLDQPRPLASLAPEMLNIIGEPLYRGSFPSGHATTAFTLAGAIILQGIPRLAGAVVLLLAILAGLSRSVVGAHWPLDILAGAFGGWLAAVIGVRLNQRWPLPDRIRTLGGILFLVCGLYTLIGYDSGYPYVSVLQFIVALAAVTVVLVMRCVPCQAGEVS